MDNDDLDNHDDKSSKILTKFMNYCEEIFDPDKKPGLKITLPKDFNDPFDSQVQLSNGYISKLRSRLSPTLTETQIEYFAKRLETVHILCFSGKSPLNSSSSNMWGLYANKGSGIAFEFEHKEIVERINCLGDLLNTLRQALSKKLGKEKLIIRTDYKPTKSLSKLYFKEFIENYSNFTSQKINLYEYIKNNISDSKLSSNTVEKGNIDDSKLLSYINFKTSLYEVGYIHDFGRLYNIFNEYLNNPKSGNKNVSLLEQFMTLKNIIWQHEQEYRLFIPDYIAKLLKEADIEAGNGNYNEAIDILNQEDSPPKIIFFDHEINYKPLTLPFPKKIYLGWGFNDASSQQKIEAFCKKYSIELLKLKKTLDIKNNCFEFKQIL